ncbi:XRE family transcriptional regulator [Cnuibacter physcomitrellae]|uniref:helix-turn-helix domain-containing protein n=1 Tax=Cnuibacter physcomitrellae TaxID=1619308 RepID=UPI0021756F1E|nr:XRE family transcriptional regulator [Cnuibacter physcomitrellae]MCS5497833.1 XRE family transcriptional regulator [Cnuibacter physcomitrellae]
MGEEVGARIRAARKAQGASLRSVASAVGVSASLLSLVENGRTQPSVSTLTALVTHLGITFDGVLGEPTVTERIPVSTPEPSFIQRGEHNPVVARVKGVRWERLSSLSGRSIDPLLVTFSPGARSTRHPASDLTAGTEHVYLLVGALTVQTRDGRRVLQPGDSLLLPIGAATSYVNEGTRPAQGIWFLVGSPDPAPMARELALFDAGRPG